MKPRFSNRAETMRELTQVREIFPFSLRMACLKRKCHGIGYAQFHDSNSINDHETALLINETVR